MIGNIMQLMLQYQSLLWRFKNKTRTEQWYERDVHPTYTSKDRMHISLLQELCFIFSLLNGNYMALILVALNF